ncbi:hypothetical protein IM816_08770 [Luteibacter flocculans]|uniref:Uncharacterized protein n=1 Tax=Luteibacter flocculans TaxID=2780091 RepID=A0ABY4T9W2_9GAMM|nr:hypothetical protein [Luteibacter flocculans]URL60150.1 hypothetical protein IM816_08770 [Luteibacter flocculans]
MQQLIETIEPLPDAIRDAKAGVLRGARFCFHDAFQLTACYPDVSLVLGFLHEDGEVYPHAWIRAGEVDFDPTSSRAGPRIALALWTHAQCRDHVFHSPSVPGRPDERAVIPPRVNRAGDIVFTEIDDRDRELLSAGDNARAAVLRAQLLAIIASAGR